MSMELVREALVRNLRFVRKGELNVEQGMKSRELIEDSG